MGRIGFFGFVLLVIAGSGVAAWLKMTGEAESVQSGFGGRVTPVAVVEVRAADFADVIEALGTARANESVTITSRATDTIAVIHFDSGAYVQAGAKLVELSDAEEAAGLKEARATLRETSRELARVEDLVAQGIVTRQRSDEAVAARERALARVQAIEARVADYIVRAPFDGVIGLRDASPGMLVRPGDAIATLDDVSVIKVDFTAPERFLQVLEVGGTVDMRAAAFPGEVFSGRVAHIDSRVDPITRSVTVRAELANPDKRILPGMLMLVEVAANERRSPAAPSLALLRSGQSAFVYAIEQGERGLVATSRPVTLGARVGDRLEVTSGLAIGDRIVAEGVHRVRPGQPVRIVGENGEEGAGEAAGARGRRGGGKEGSPGPSARPASGSATQ